MVTRAAAFAGSQAAVLVTTYNRPGALAWTLAALSQQTVMPGQIVIADDGSGEPTRQLVARWQAYFQRHHQGTRVLHAWQPDQGFRAAAARNLAVTTAIHDDRPQALIFLDGDCLAPAFFVEHHLQLLRPGGLVAGGRGLLSQPFTEQIEPRAPLLNEQSDAQEPTDIRRALRPFASPYWLWLSKRCDRFWPMQAWMSPALGGLRDRHPVNEAAVRTCNLSLTTEAFESVGGFDERFVGWGLEDTDFAIRLLAKGIRVRSGRFATNVYHLWHAERSRDQLQANGERLEQTRRRTEQEGVR